MSFGWRGQFSFATERKVSSEGPAKEDITREFRMARPLSKAKREAKESRIVQIGKDGIDFGFLRAVRGD